MDILRQATNVINKTSEYDQQKLANGIGRELVVVTIKIKEGNVARFRETNQQVITVNLITKSSEHYQSN
jgi:hypothetical protein